MGWIKPTKITDIRRPWPGTNFTPWEMVRSATALRLGIDNTPRDPRIWEQLEWLVYNILQPIRERFGPIRVLSGYRCDALNTAVGGSPRSLHRIGQAADIEPVRKDVSLWDVLKFAYEHTQCSELIAEYITDGWVHVGGSAATKVSWRRLKLKNADHDYTMFNSLQALKSALEVGYERL